MLIIAQKTNEYLCSKSTLTLQHKNDILWEGQKESKVGGSQRILVKTIQDLKSEFLWSNDKSLGLTLLLKAQRVDQVLWRERSRLMLAAGNR